MFPSQEIDPVNTLIFEKPLLTPQVLSVFTVISDDMQKYFAICVRVCTKYYRVGHSLILLYYEILLLFTK